MSAGNVPSPAGARDAGDHGARFWIGVAIGGALMAYGTIGLLRNLSGDALVNWGLFFVGADLLHDGVVAPLVFLGGAALARLLPAPWRTPVIAGCVISAAVLLVVFAPLVGLGGNPGNPTLRPLDYTTSTLTALVVVWATVGTVSLLVAARDRRRPPDS